MLELITGGLIIALVSLLIGMSIGGILTFSYISSFAFRLKCPKCNEVIQLFLSKYLI